jgi:hypothetical protein
MHPLASIAPCCLLAFSLSLCVIRFLVLVLFSHFLSFFPRVDSSGGSLLFLIADPEVNNALHELYIEEEDFDALRASTSKFANFDSAGLAKRLAGNELLEFKRIAATLYRNNKRWKQSIELSKADNLYKDAMETAAESQVSSLASSSLVCESSRHFFYIACLHFSFFLIFRIQCVNSFAGP